MKMKLYYGALAFIRSKSKWDSGTAENILRRHTMKYLNPSFYGQQ